MTATASRRTSPAERSFRSATTSISSASSVGNRMKSSVKRRHSSKSSSTASLHGSASVASLRSVSASQSKASSRNRSVASHDTYSVGSRKSNLSTVSIRSQSSDDDDSVTPMRSSNTVSSRRSMRSTPSFQEQLELLSDKSQRSGSVLSGSGARASSDDDDSVTPMRSSNSVPSRRSTRSTPSFQEQLELLSNRSQRSGSVLSGSGARTSPRSVASHASHTSNHSRRSHRSSSSRKSSMSNSHRSTASTSSRKSVISRKSVSATSRKSGNSSRHSSTVSTEKFRRILEQHLQTDQSTNSNGEEKTSSLQQKGQAQLERKRYAEAIKSFTSAIRTCVSSQEWSGSDGDKSIKGMNWTLAMLHRYRCESLYEIGLYELAAWDARKALKFGQSDTNSDPTDNGLVLQGKMLSLLGYSLLRIGNSLRSAKKAFDGSIELTKEAINNTKILSESEKQSTSLDDSKRLLKMILEDSKNGLNEIGTYEKLEEQLKDSSRKGYIIDLDSILDITPGNTDLHVQKVKHLINRKRWFEVANHCEQMAAKASRYCDVGVFKGDLQDANPFPAMKLEELDPDYFTRRDIVVPQHLRVLPTAATHEAASLLPKKILPYYVTSLRLEDRCDAALLVGRFLRKTGASVDKIDQEWGKVNETIKLREEGNIFFRSGEFGRAASLYKQCLQVCSDTNTGGQINAVLHYNLGRCSYSMSQYQDACIEFTDAISIHSMYSDAILERARCYIQMKDLKKASANFNRYLTLVEGAREHPYPPPYKGSDCFFDMPSDVTYRQVEAVKAEMKDHKIDYNISNQKRNNAQLDFSSFTQKLNVMFTELCCRKDAHNQVVVNRQQQGRQDPPRYNEAEPRISDGSNRRSSINSRTPGTKLVRFIGDPPSRSASIRSRSSDLEVLQSEFDTKDGRDP